jgi:N-acetylglucosamine kinase-like BadF-type ATPase
VADGIAIGVDAGATKTSGVLVSRGGAVLRRENAGGANIAASDEHQVVENLRRVLEPLAQGETIRAVCVAAAGSGRREARNTLKRIVASILPGVARLTICSDARAWLRAGTTKRPAMVVTAGTGSIAYGERADGTVVRAGGHGAALGDAGSGFAIGLSALGAAAHALAGSAPRSAFVQDVLQAIGGKDSAHIVEFASGDRATVAALASIVASASVQGDEAASRILAGQADALGRLARLVASEVRSRAALPVVLAGGVLDQIPALSRGVSVELLESGPCEFIRPATDAAAGAATLALESL